MYIQNQKHNSWRLPDSAVTPQSHYLGRRQFLRTCGLGLAVGALLPTMTQAATFGFPDSLNATDSLPGVKLTPYDAITGYNNFYEWGITATGVWKPGRW
jgi:sulfoxide reductase catalytic subunit YedY